MGGVGLSVEGEWSGVRMQARVVKHVCVWGEGVECECDCCVGEQVLVWVRVWCGYGFGCVGCGCEQLYGCDVFLCVRQLLGALIGWIWH